MKKHNKLFHKVYLKHFWRILLYMIRYDFWVVNRKIATETHFYGFSHYQEIKKFAKQHGYVVTPYYHNKFTEYQISKNGLVLAVGRRSIKNRDSYRSQNHGSMKTTREMTFNNTDIMINKTFMLNRSKTARYIMEAMIYMVEELEYRDKLWEELSKRIDKEGKKFINSDDFLKILHKLSYQNYFDILELKSSYLLSTKEKKQYVADYCDLNPVYLNDYIEEEKFDVEYEKNNEIDWNFTDDYIPTALTRGAIDSVICINPNKIHNLKLDKDIIDRLHKAYFSFMDFED